MQRARRDDVVTVDSKRIALQAGDGGDELFGGYRSFQKVQKLGASGLVWSSLGLRVR